MGSDVTPEEEHVHGNTKYSQAIKNTCYQLRIDGMPYREISKLMDIPEATIYGWVSKAIKASVRESGEELRKLAEERYDMLIFHAKELLSHPHPDIRLKASAQLLRVEEARDRLLGLNAPDKHVVSEERTSEEDALLEMIRKQRKLNESKVKEMRESDV